MLLVTEIKKPIVIKPTSMIDKNVTSRKGLSTGARTIHHDMSVHPTMFVIVIMQDKAIRMYAICSSFIEIIF